MAVDQVEKARFFALQFYVAAKETKKAFTHADRALRIKLFCINTAAKLDIDALKSSCLYQFFSRQPLFTAKFKLHNILTVDTGKAKLEKF